MWLVSNCRNGVSSCEIARDLGLTQKTAWFMLHRIREAMQDKTATKLKGEVEVDESFIGGKSRNRHNGKRQGRPGNMRANKTIVAGAVERKGNVVARVVAAILGTVAVWLTYLTGRRLFGKEVGLIAAAIFALGFGAAGFLAQGRSVSAIISRIASASLRPGNDSGVTGSKTIRPVRSFSSSMAAL